MKIDRDARRCALQAMYQFDAVGAGDHEIIRESLEGSSAAPENQEKGFALATLAWEFREESDEMILRFSPDWPIPSTADGGSKSPPTRLYEINHGGDTGEGGDQRGRRTGQGIRWREVSGIRECASGSRHARGCLMRFFRKAAGAVRQGLARTRSGSGDGTPVSARRPSAR